jgi:hypothetical protein
MPQVRGHEWATQDGEWATAMEGAPGTPTQDDGWAIRQDWLITGHDISNEN